MPFKVAAPHNFNNFFIRVYISENVAPCSRLDQLGIHNTPFWHVALTLVEKKLNEPRESLFKVLRSKVLVEK